jgi:RHS repeat-associated protein
VRTTLMIGNVEIVTENGQTKTKRYLPGGAFEITQNAVANTRYMFTDHLGNIVQIATELGASVEAMDYTAFGARRDFIQPQQLPASPPTLTTKGYTGHEMVDEMGLIHMNGRIFDTRTARFMQADPMVQDPSNGQNFNRYTYVWNNPLAYTDPTGYFSVKKFFSAVSQVVGILSYFIPGLQWVGYALNVVSAALNGGLKAGLLAAFTGLIRLPSGMNEALKLGINIAIAGVSSVIMGGKFGEGVVGALKSAAIGFAFSQMGAAYQSRQTGSKMENGAETEAFDAAQDCKQQRAVQENTAKGSSADPSMDKDTVNQDFKRNKNVTVSRCGNSREIDISVRLARGENATDAQFNEVVSGINSWEGTYSSRRVSYTVRVNLEIVEIGDNPDVIVDSTGSPCLSARAIVGGTKGASDKIWMDNFRPGSSGAHEFGHILGLGHRQPLTQSIMSYNLEQRHITSQDAGDIYRLYGGK